MATNKAKRSIHLAQPQRPRLRPEPAELMPVKAHIYRTMAEMNGGFEQALQGLQTLQKINYFASGALLGMHKQLAQMRSQASRQLMAILMERETANADHFQRLCIESEKDEPQSAIR